MFTNWKINKFLKKELSLSFSNQKTNHIIPNSPESKINKQVSQNPDFIFKTAWQLQD
jgi:hypothetical protein